MAVPKSSVVVHPLEVATEDVTFFWGSIFLMLFAFVTIGRIQEVIPALASLHVGVLTGGLAGIMWFLVPGSLRDKIPMRIPQVKYVVWLFLLSLLLVPVGVWPGNSFDFITS